MKAKALVLAMSLVCPALAAAAEAALAKNFPKGITPLVSTNLHNLFRISTNLYSGSSPDNETGFAELARIGIKTIISVDGGKPNVELAHKYGMRYVHLPHGYDGIDTNTQTQLIKAAEISAGPLFVHCHHGLHRGPTAAAVICMARSGWSPAFADEWLKAAGTGSNYLGLYQTVRQFQKPSAEQLSQVPSQLPEIAKVSGLVASMVAIDEHWDYFKVFRKAGYQKPKEHPDAQPAHEAVILWEQMREAQRLDDSSELGKDFLEQLKSAETLVQAFEKTLRKQEAEGTDNVRSELDRQFNAVAQSCATCHKAYRDRRN
ncbi:MAG TPA: hypothetical protein VK846_12835 [Candidatus Limnocylindria bacterium]|nr:hypothetical protein [Candidatus Limnocylindria bacterium]